MKKYFLYALIIFVIALSLKIAAQNIVAYVFILLPVIVCFVHAREMVEIPKNIKIFYILYFSGVIIANTFGINPSNSWAHFHTSIKLVLLIPLIYLVDKFHDRIKIILSIYVIALSVQNLFSLELVISNLGHVPRLTGWLGHYMTYSGILLIQIFIMIYLLYVSKKLLWRAFYFSLIVIAFIILLYTQTRGAVAGVGCGILTMVIVSIIRKDKKIILLSVFLILLSMFVFHKSDLINHRFVTFESIGKDRTFENRLKFWSFGEKIIQKHWFTGIGINNISSLYHDAENPLYGHVHNDYLQIYLENGLLGIIGFLFLMFSSMVVFLKTFFRTYDWIFLAPVLIIIAFMVNGIVEYNWGDSEVAMNLIFILSIGYGMYKSQRLDEVK